MMLSKLAVILMAATAFAPAFLVYALVWVMHGCYWKAVFFAGLCFGLVGLCLFLMAQAEKKLTRRSYTPISISTADSEVMNFLLIYLLPLITRDLATYNWFAWIVIALIFCVVVATSYSYHFNPLLVLCGYHFYKVSDKEGMSHVLITKKRLFRANDDLTVGMLSEYVPYSKGLGISSSSRIGDIWLT